MGETGLANSALRDARPGRDNQLGQHQVFAIIIAGRHLPHEMIAERMVFLRQRIGNLAARGGDI